MISESKAPNSVRACTIWCLTLGPAEHEAESLQQFIWHRRHWDLCKTVKGKI